MVPKISLYLELLEIQIWLKVEANQPATVEELAEVGKSLRFFAGEVACMERQLAGETDAMPAGNVLAFRRPGATPLHSGEPT